MATTLQNITSAWSQIANSINFAAWSQIANNLWNIASAWSSVLQSTTPKLSKDTTDKLDVWMWRVWKDQLLKQIWDKLWTDSTSYKAASDYINSQTVTNQPAPLPASPNTTTPTTNQTLKTKLEQKYQSPAPTPAPTSTPTNSTYKWNSIVDYLSSNGQNSSFSNRQKMAEKLWITNYTWTADQNIQMLNLLKWQKTTDTTTPEWFKWYTPDQVWIPWVNMPSTTTNKKTDTTTTTTNNNIVDTSKITDPYTKYLSSIDNSKINTLDTIKWVELSNLWQDYTNSSKIAAWNNSALLKLYWIDSNWNVDTTNTDWFAYKYQKLADDYEKTKRDQMNAFKWTRLAQVQWELRAALLARWVDVSTIPPEQLIALSWAVWQKAFTDIYNAKTTMEDQIATNTKDAMTQISLLREKWLISVNELKTNLEKLKETYQNSIVAINKDFVKTVFGIWDVAKTSAENDMKDTINTATKLATDLWLSGTAIWVISDYVNNSPDATTAYQAMIKDLNNKNSALYKAVNDAKVSANLLTQYELETKRIAATKVTSPTASSLSALQSWVAASMWLWNLWLDDATIKANWTNILWAILNYTAYPNWVDMWGWVIITPTQLSNWEKEYRKLNPWIISTPQ